MKRWLCVPLVATWALAACGSISAPNWFVRTYLGEPSGLVLSTADLHGLSPIAVWGAPDQIAVVTWWSSGCPKLPIDLNAAGNALTLTLSSGTSPYGSSCTADAAPTTTVIRLPHSVDQAQPVTLAFIDGSTRSIFVLQPRLPG